MARPCKLTPEIKEVLICAISKISHRNVACQIAGIRDQTLRNWLAKGAEDNAVDPFRSFRVDFLRAEANMEQELSSLVLKSARGHGDTLGDWKAAAYILERRSGHNWNPKTQVEHSGPDGGPIKVTPAAAAAAVREEFGSHAAVKSGSERDDDDIGDDGRSA